MTEYLLSHQYLHYLNYMMFLFFITPAQLNNSPKWILQSSFYAATRIEELLNELKNCIYLSGQIHGT